MLRLEFDDPTFNGLIVKTRSASLEFLVRMQELMQFNLADPEHEDDKKELFTKMSSLMSGPGLGWNLTDDDGKAVGTGPAQLAKEEWPLIKLIARAWVLAVADVPAPLSRPSSDGDRLAGLSIPMEPLSSDPQSLSPQNESSD